MRGYLGLGSNEGDRLGALRTAREELERREIVVVASSSVYETAPQGEVLDQPDFLNACLTIETDLDPERLLDACKEVERALGRVPGGPRHGPRAIDVDVLLLGDLVHDSDRLTLPHPEVSARRFVLEPLLELDPDLTLPDGTPLAARLSEVADQPVSRVGPFPAGQVPRESGGASPR
ncbi:MAG TPA: 2-amino-4-hydroxy-6-hydroxymethyldihydropteridine diphosphokinase [Thermoleophilaceae bacterium]|nr:2-amino-4-hydroxy-6-hydroxymethyldihydropteridine diphosphokinase [Thermoleophilaceae bacterium]